MENCTLYRVFLMISIFISSRSWGNGWETGLNYIPYLLIDAGLEEGSQGGVHQDSTVQLSRSAGETWYFIRLSMYEIPRYFIRLSVYEIQRNFIRLSMYEITNQPGDVYGLHLLKAAQRMALANLDKEMLTPDSGGQLNSPAPRLASDEGCL